MSKSDLKFLLAISYLFFAFALMGIGCFSWQSGYYTAKFQDYGIRGN